MSEDEKMTVKEFHRKMAVETNNGVWPFLDKANPTQEDLEEALHMAHASRYHWSKVGQPINIARAEYVISRVYSAMKRAEPAIYHAKRCLEMTEQAGVKDFDIAFAYEVMTRARALAGRKADCKKLRALAQKAIDDVKEPEDKKICQTELDKVTC